MEGGKIYTGDFMSNEERMKFWDFIYDNISLGINKGLSYVILLGFGELIGKPEIDDDETGYTLVIEKDQYLVFLSNYLIWCEEMELYERCSEIKILLNKIETKSSTHI